MTEPRAQMIADQLERDRALRPDRSFIVQAPAGSGKTGLLIQRYLRLLSLADAPEEIIAITFTRKAAAEMRGRVLVALERAGRAEVPDSGHDKEILELARAALSRAEKRAWRIMENPARLRIQTIDSLSAALTRQMPLLARLGTQPETVQDAAGLYQQAAHNTLAGLESAAAWPDAIARLMAHLDNDLPRIGTLLVEMLAKRDQWLGYVVKAHDRGAMEHALAALIEAQLAHAAGIFPPQQTAALTALLDYAAGHLVKSAPGNPITHCRAMDGLPPARAGRLDQWRGISELLLAREGAWRKQWSKAQGFPPAGGADPEAAERRRHKKLMQALSLDLQRTAGLREALAAIKQLPNARYSEAEWGIVEALCELLKLAAAELRLIFAEQNRMDFIGIAEAALGALGDEHAPTDLALSLDYQIKHLLVDEYQDISVSQYRLLQRLTREWSPGDGRSLFLVGDPMQSIYRFREAEVGLFIQTFQARCLGSVPLRALRLKVNFRSDEALVRWINKAFKGILPGRDDALTGAVSFSPAEAFAKGGADGAVAVYPLYSPSEAAEARRVLAVIREIKQRAPEDSIALLARSRAHLAAIIPALRGQGIAFAAIEIEALGRAPAIQDLLALTRAYLFPADRVAWLACLRAPWCGLGIDSLFRLAHPQKGKTLWQCIHDPALIASLAAAERARLSRFSAVFTRFIRQRQRLPLRQALESLWHELGGPATARHAAELENCETFFDLIERLDQAGRIDPRELARQVGRLFAAADRPEHNPLQIMTMHKAKGLEFDHVVLPGLGRPPRAGRSGLLAWQARPDKKRRPQLILAPIRASGDKEAPLYDYIKHIDKVKQTHEDARLLYVAATRAKKTLRLIGHAAVRESRGERFRQAKKGSLLRHLWPLVKQDYEQDLPQRPEPDDEASDVLNQDTRRLSPTWTLPAPPAGLKWQAPLQSETGAGRVEIEFEWAGATIRHIGSVVHQMIQWIAEEGIERWPAARALKIRAAVEGALRQQGVPAAEIPAAAAQVEAALVNMLNDEKGRWLLSGSHRQRQNEYPLSGVYDGRLVNVALDRTFIDQQGTRWIIDYKTGRHEGRDVEGFLDHEQRRYRPQLEKYGALMRQLGAEEIRLGLYFPLLRGWREWGLGE